MHIAFDVSQTGKNKAGCGYFAHALTLGLIESASIECLTLLTSLGDFFHDRELARQPPYRGRRVKVGPRHASFLAAQSFWSRADVEDRLGQPDILHSNNFWCPTQLRHGRLVYTLYDLSFLLNPDWTTEANRVGCFEGVFRASIVADWIVAISDASRRHFLEVFPHFPSERIQVIYPASRFRDPEQAGLRPQLARQLQPECFWLSVGTLEPRKNQLGLLQAYAAYRAATGSTMPLVLAGGRGWMMDDFERQIAALELADSVLLTGYVQDEELIWLYRHCFANVYPSFHEGFGLPVLEAMQFGAPTLSSNAGSLPEVAGTACPMFGPEDTETLTRAMIELHRQPDRRIGYRALGYEQQAKFRWESSLAALLELYRLALSLPKRSEKS